MLVTVKTPAIQGAWFIHQTANRLLEDFSLRPTINHFCWQGTALLKICAARVLDKSTTKACFLLVVQHKSLLGRNLTKYQRKQTLPHPHKHIALTTSSFTVLWKTHFIWNHNTKAREYVHTQQQNNNMTPQLNAHMPIHHMCNAQHRHWFTLSAKHAQICVPLTQFHLHTPYCLDASESLAHAGLHHDVVAQNKKMTCDIRTWFVWNSRSCRYTTLHIIRYRESRSYTRFALNHNS